jgi:hypothetical protein
MRGGEGGRWEMEGAERKAREFELKLTLLRADFGPVFARADLSIQS